jgi:pyridinium-3,5-bisthiocarboxylic acid mononucleotide nickel chelatase
MKTIYFDCFSGASGDMILGALFDLGLSLPDWRSEMEKLGLGNSAISTTAPVSRGGIRATRFSVECNEISAPPRLLADILSIIENSTLEADIKERSSNAFRRLAACESEIHGKNIDEVHFHELSGLDTIVDIVGTFVAFKMLGIAYAASSAVNVGSGVIECAHGLLPVPAPATAKLLAGVPVYSRSEGELTTPTGALLITELSSAFGDMPDMTVGKIGYGAGAAERKLPNLLRVFLCEPRAAASIRGGQVLYHLATNIDDIDPRAIGYLLERILEEGALDAYMQPAYMKKNRPGVIFNVLCEAAFVSRAIDMILSETSTLGVRVLPTPRICIDRRAETIETEFGPIGVKLALIDGQVRRANPEYEDCAAAARKTGVPLMKIIDTVRAEAVRTFADNQDTTSI